MSTKKTATIKETDLAVQKPLFAIVQEGAQIIKELAESGGDLSPALEHLLGTNEQEIAVKIDAYVAVMDQLKGSAMVLRSRADEFKRASEAMENAGDRCEQRLKDALEILGTDELRGDRHTYKKTVTAQIALDIVPDELPMNYKKQEVKWTPDRTLIMPEIEAGLPVAGVTARKVVRYRFVPTK